MKTGLFGGTFDPIHNGHVKLAEFAKNRLELDRIIFVPSGDPPHKSDKKVTGKAHRLAMVQAALKESEAEISEWEMEREAKSYSVDLVKHFKKEFPEDTFYFIIGADSFRDLPSWWHYRELLELCTFVVVSRPDTDEDDLLSRYEGTEKPPRVFFLPDLMMDISSTQIRERVKAGKDIAKLVPEAVLRYINDHGLYR
ncbi:MAG: nicotinate (nicotinamide) nucleotide adenylyltransferase [Ruminococcaceae bacterium]|nr:nicotinate (nicotinamide) nucleotide adenylyltransferase [Oscillospiraceae bacterium]